MLKNAKEELSISRDTVSRRLKELRHDKGVSQGDAAYYIGISRKTLSDVESGRAYMSERTCVKICDYYGVDEDYLRGYKQSRVGEKDPVIYIMSFLREQFEEKQLYMMARMCEYATKILRKKR